MVNRRQFLGTATRGGVLAAICGLAFREVVHGPDVDVLARPELLADLGPETVREIGEAFRRLVPAEGTVHALLASLRAQGTHEPIASRTRDDFAAGRIVVVDGWVLSMTEARRCALFSLRAT